LKDQGGRDRDRFQISAYAFC